jgi:hypothetical protein
MSITPGRYTDQPIKSTGEAGGSIWRAGRIVGMDEVTPSKGYIYCRRISSICGTLELLVLFSVFLANGQLSSAVLKNLIFPLFVTLGVGWWLLIVIYCYWPCPKCGKCIQYARLRSYGNPFTMRCVNCESKIKWLW